MRALSVKIGISAMVAILALPASAMAQRVVPPGNSAVTQYTETIPTARGNAKPGHHHRHSAAAVIGRHDAHQLEAAGVDGRAVAEIVAATAPAMPGNEQQGSPHKRGEPGAASDSGGSGLGEVITAATGSSDSGDLGLLLPLIIVCALIGAAAYALRQRRRIS